MVSMTLSRAAATVLRRAVDPPVITPSSRLLWWLKFSFVGDALLAALGGALLVHDEEAGWFMLVFAALRAVLGVVGLVLAMRALEHRRAVDDQPSVIH